MAAKSRKTKGLMSGTIAVQAYHVGVFFVGIKALSWRLLNRKLLIYIISEKEDNLLRYAQNFEISFLEISVPFDFGFRIHRIFGWMFRFSENQQLPDFLELFPGNFRTIRSHCSFRLNGKRLIIFFVRYSF